MNRTMIKAFATSVAALGILGGSLVVAQPATARDLPTAYEAELRDAKKARFGQTINLTACSKSSGFSCSKYARLAVTIESLTFRSPNGWPEGTPLYDINVRISNYATRSTGVLPKLRCSNAQEEGAFYIDSVETQSIPPRSRTSGAVVSAFPLGPQGSDAPAIAARDCKDAVIWIESPVQTDARAGKTRTFGSAYIPVPPRTLNALNQQADAAFAAAPTTE